MTKEKETYFADQLHYRLLRRIRRGRFRGP